MSRDFTTPREALEKLLTFPRRLTRETTNAFQNEKIFEVEVISEISFYGSTGDDPESIIFEGDANQTGVGLTKGFFKGRIVKENMSHFLFLERPEDTSIPSDDDRDAIYRSLHTTVVFTGIDPDVSDLKYGDVILAKAKPGDKKNIYDLQFLEYVKVRKRSDSSLKSSSSRPSFCKMKSLFEESDPGPPPDLDLQDEITVSYWFAGQPPNQYGSNFVSQVIETQGIATKVNDDTSIIAHLNSSKDHLIIVGNFEEVLGNMEGIAGSIAAINESTIINTNIGAWSGGARGIGAALSSGQISDFGKIILADPAPYELLTSLAPTLASLNSVNMNYNLLWWQTTYSDWFANKQGTQALENFVNTLTAPGSVSTVIHREDLNSLITPDTSGINGISTAAHEALLIEQLKIIMS